MIPCGDIHHLRLTVTDVQRSREFYTGLLGFEVVVESPPPGDPAADEAFKVLFGGVVMVRGNLIMGLRPMAPAADRFTPDRACGACTSASACAGRQRRELPRSDRGGPGGGSPDPARRRSDIRGRRPRRSSLTKPFHQKQKEPNSPWHSSAPTGCASPANRGSSWRASTFPAMPVRLKPFSASATATWASAAPIGRGRTLNSPARSSTVSTKRGTSSTPRTLMALPARDNGSSMFRMPTTSTSSSTAR